MLERAPTGSDNPLVRGWGVTGDDRGRFEAALQQALVPQAAYLSGTEHELYAGGKKIRPLLLLLSCRLVAGRMRTPDKAIQGAVSLEMLHVATLIHDDIVDDSETRRGLSSVHAARGTEAAVLIGDLQFIQAIRVFAASIDCERDMGLVRLVLDVGFKICCGELDELMHAREAEPEAMRRHYMRTIDRKTAILFGLACEVGATLGGGRTRDIYMLSQYGRNLGRAFQLMDDLFDLVSDPERSGKPRAADLAQRRWTLPIINARADVGDEHVLARVMAGHETDPEAVEAARCAVVASRGFEAAYNFARRQAIEASAQLHGFPEGPVRGVLNDLARYVVDRGMAG